MYHSLETIQKMMQENQASSATSDELDDKDILVESLENRFSAGTLRLFFSINPNRNFKEEILDGDYEAFTCKDNKVFMGTSYKVFRTYTKVNMISKSKNERFSLYVCHFRQPEVNTIRFLWKIINELMVINETLYKPDDVEKELSSEDLLLKRSNGDQEKGHNKFRFDKFDLKKHKFILTVNRPSVPLSVLIDVLLNILCKIHDGIIKEGEYDVHDAHIEGRDDFQIIVFKPVCSSRSARSIINDNITEALDLSSGPSENPLILNLPLLIGFNNKDYDFISDGLPEYFA